MPPNIKWNASSKGSELQTTSYLSFREYVSLVMFAESGRYQHQRPPPTSILRTSSTKRSSVISCSTKIKRFSHDRPMYTMARGYFGENERGYWTDPSSSPSLGYSTDHLVSSLLTQRVDWPVRTMPLPPWQDQGLNYTPEEKKNMPHLLKEALYSGTTFIN